MQVNNKNINSVTIIGGGVIGSSWAALFLAHGLSVCVSDPMPGVSEKVLQQIERTKPYLKSLGYQVDHLQDGLKFESDNVKAVADADVVQECGPENLNFKQNLWQSIEAAVKADALLLSSSSSIPASVQNIKMKNLERLVIGHPFNPPHLIPLVEVIAPAGAPAELVKDVLAFYTALNKKPVLLDKEIAGFVANRLQAALFQECVYLVQQGVASAEKIDEVVTQSLGIRWATSGPFLSFELGGGAGGFADFVKHLGPALAGLWKALGNNVQLDQKTSDIIVSQLAQAYGSHSFPELEDKRDRDEIAVMKAMHD